MWFGASKCLFASISASVKWSWWYLPHIRSAECIGCKCGFWCPTAWVHSLACHCVAVRLWASYLTLLCLSFYICKTKMIIVPHMKCDISYLRLLNICLATFLKEDQNQSKAWNDSWPLNIEIEKCWNAGFWWHFIIPFMCVYLFLIKKHWIVDNKKCSIYRCFLLPPRKSI